jgi:putative transposase
MVAWVVLPDHVHMIVTHNKWDISAAMKHFKLKFSGLFRSRHHLTSGRIWQYRFWDHVIRDSSDQQRHIDYIHYNPVKHGLVAVPFGYEHSSLAQFYRDGFYQRDWGVTLAVDDRGEFGE